MRKQSILLAGVIGLLILFIFSTTAVFAWENESTAARQRNVLQMLLNGEADQAIKLVSSVTDKRGNDIFSLQVSIKGEGFCYKGQIMRDFRINDPLTWDVEFMDFVDEKMPYYRIYGKLSEKEEYAGEAWIYYFPKSHWVDFYAKKQIDNLLFEIAHGELVPVPGGLRGSIQVRKEIWDEVDLYYLQYCKMWGSISIK